MTTETLTPDALASAKALPEKAVLLILERGRFQNVRAVPVTEIASAEIKPYREQLAATKRLLASKALRNIDAIDRAVTRQLDVWCLPSPFRFGVFTVPLTLVPTVNMYLQTQAENRTNAVHAFVAEYAALIADAQNSLGPLFRANDYAPTDRVGETFKMIWSWATINTPSSLSLVSSELYASERAKAEAKMVDAVHEIELALRVGFKELVDKMVERLQPGEDGKPKMVTKHFGENLREFLDVFEARNLSNDASLATLVSQARTLTGVVDVDTIRDSAAFRGELASAFAELSQNVEVLTVESRARRAITLR